MSDRKKNKPIVEDAPIPVSAITFTSATAAERIENWVNESLSAKLLAWQRDSTYTGMLSAMQDALRTMVYRWGYLRSALKKATDCVTAYRWDILPYVEKKNDDPTPEDQRYAEMIDACIYARAELRKGMWEHDFETLLTQIATAPFRGTYVAEVDYSYDPKAQLIVPRRYRTVQPTNYGWTAPNDGPDMLVFYPDGNNNTNRWMPFPDDKFIVAIGDTVGDHPIFASVLVSLIPWYIAAECGLKEALSFISHFAQPVKVAKYGGKQQQKDAVELMKKWGNSTWLVAPKNLELELINAYSGGGSSPHLSLVQAAQSQVDIVIGGQKLASGTSDTGSNSRALGEVHNEVRKEVCEAVASFVRRILNTQLVPALLRLNLGELPEHLPSIEFTDPNNHADAATLDFVLRVAEVVPVKKQWVYEQLNIPMPAEGDELFQPVGSTPYGADDENPWREGDEDDDEPAARAGEDNEDDDTTPNA